MNAFLILIPLLLLSSCSGQVSPAATDHPSASVIIGDTVTATGNNVMVVYQDKKNNYWFGSWEDGLYRYDGTVMLHFSKKDGLAANRVDEIKEDKSGNIYVNTPQGISKFNGHQFITLPLIERNEWKLQDHDLWFKGAKGPIRYDGNYAYHLKLPQHYLEGKSFVINPANSWTSYDIYTIYKDSKGYIWMGTAVIGACRYNGKSVDWISEEDLTELHNGPANGVRSIMEDKDGYFWFNTQYRYRVHDTNTVQPLFYNREKSIGSLDGKKGGDLNEYLSITKDNNNGLWIATYRDGVWHYDGKKVTHHLVKAGNKDITIFSIYKDNQGTLWLGTHENGAYQFNGKTFERFKN